MKFKKNFYILLFLIFIIKTFSWTESQQLYISSSTEEQNFDFETPRYFKFYYPPELYETPSVDYDEILIPYTKYVSPEIEKIKVDNSLFYRPGKYQNRLSCYIGNNNILTLCINSISAMKITNCSITNKKISVARNDKYYNELYGMLEYEHIHDNLVFGSNFSYWNKYISEARNQYNANFVIRKLISKKVELFSYPTVSLFHDELTNRLFVYNIFGVNILFNKMMLTCGTKWFNFDKKEKMVYNIDYTVDDLLLQELALNTGCDYDVHHNRLYYNVEFRKKIGMSSFSISKNRKLLYNFINRYFLDLAQVKFDDFVFYYPEVESINTAFLYKRKNFSTEITLNKQTFTSYPTYIFDNGVVRSYSLDNIESISVIVNTKFTTLNKISLYHVFNYTILPKDGILFHPLVSSDINFYFNVAQNIQFLIKLLYKDKIKVSDHPFNRFYLGQQIFAEIDLGYNLKENTIFSITAGFPLKGENYIQPDIYVKPYICAGISLRF